MTDTNNTAAKTTILPATGDAKPLKRASRAREPMPRDRRDVSSGPPVAPSAEIAAAPARDEPGFPTILPRPGSLAARSAAVGKAVAGVRAIRLPEPRQLAVQAEFDEVMITGIAMRGMPMLGMTLFEVTGCGKTTAAEQYAKRANLGAAPQKVPVLHVRLDNSGTARSLYVEMLAALGDGFALNGTEQSLRRRALDALGDAETGLVIIDESHHGGKQSGFGGAVTSSVKLMLDGGVVPIALLGTDLAVPIFAKDKELSGRLTAPCHLGPLVWYDDYDQEIWRGFLTALDERLVSDGIVAGPANLAREGLDLALIEATNGVIGQLMGTIRTAVRETVRDGRDTISFEDLVSAVDMWNVGHGFVTRNPLRDL